MVYWGTDNTKILTYNRPRVKPVITGYSFPVHSFYVVYLGVS